MLVRLTGLEHSRGEVWLVWSIGIIFRFQAKRGAVGVSDALFANRFAVEKIATVELNRRLVGGYFHHAAGFGIFDASSETHAIGFA